MKFSRQMIPAKNVALLTWCGNTLVDWVSAGAVYHLDGTCRESRSHWGFPFNAAHATPDGRFAVVYQRQGTKALLLHNGKILRELNRSFYHAEAYEYPVCLWQTSEGRTLIAHCPEEYCRIDIDDAETGARLTNGIRKPEDFFHSRLMVNATGTHLLSAGWVWHPWDSVVFYDIAEALRNPTHLDNSRNTVRHAFNVDFVEQSSACWQTAERVLLGASDENVDHADAEAAAEIGEPRLHPRGVAVYDVAAKAYIRSIVLGEVPGTMMPVGETYVVCFYRYPKLVSLESGEIIMRWEDLDSGSQVSSIIWDAPTPPLAMDPEHQRFAVFNSEGITVIQIDLNG